MAAKSRIEWTEVTWNPVTGCTKVSPGCKFCYAESMARRLRAMGVDRYRSGFKLTLQEDLIDLPKRWRKPRTVFVNSMSDLFHDEVPLEFTKRVFATMEQTPQHTYQILTKRSHRLREIASHLPWPRNVWVGVSVEDQQRLSRIPDLVEVPAAVRFLSIEPLLEALPDIPLRGVHWVIVGGESGHQARPIQKHWVREIRDQCIEEGVPFFFKQWGGKNKKKAGRLLDKRTWNEMPRDTIKVEPTLFRGSQHSTSQQPDQPRLW